MRNTFLLWNVWFFVNCLLLLSNSKFMVPIMFRVKHKLTFSRKMKKITTAKDYWMNLSHLLTSVRAKGEGILKIIAKKWMLLQLHKFSNGFVKKRVPAKNLSIRKIRCYHYLCKYLTLLSRMGSFADFR